MSDLEYPADLRYTEEHEWVRSTGDTVRVGITAFAQDSLGDVVYVSLPNVGDSVSAGDTCGEDTAPELVNSDPYGEGWMYELRLTDSTSVDSLMDVETYRGHLS